MGQSLLRLEPDDRWQRRFIAEGGEVVPAGPFRAFIDPRTSSIWMNYAAPVERTAAAAEIRAGIRELLAIFADRRRTLRLEYNEPLYPELSPILATEGFTLPEREPLMLLTPDRFRPAVPAAAEVDYLREDADDADLAAYQTIVFGILEELPWAATGESLTSFRAEVDRHHGRAHALATIGGEPAGTGFISASGGVAEIARVATLPEWRRRGVASAVTCFLVADRFAAGDTLLWLTAQTPEALALYSRLGFVPSGDRLYFQSTS